MKRMLRRMLERQLPEGYDIDTHFTPDYDPWDQRLCLVPDGDLFQAHPSRARRASSPTGSGPSPTTGSSSSPASQLEADVVVTATGLNLELLGGAEVHVDGEPVDLPNPVAYKGMMLSGVPNAALALGYTNASWTLKCDLISQYVCRLLRAHATSTATTASPRASPIRPSRGCRSSI